MPLVARESSLSTLAHNSCQEIICLRCLQHFTRWDHHFKESQTYLNRYQQTTGHALLSRQQPPWIIPQRIKHVRVEAQWDTLTDFIAF